MKLRAKSDHRIREFGIDERNAHPYYTRDEYGNTCYYKTLKEVADNWEDYEEPKGYWYIDCAAPYPVDFCEFNEDTEYDKEIGNYFKTKEEAEKAVEKLKAFKRLKDKGFRFNGWIREHKKGSANITIASFIDEDYDITNDIDLLFGGEE